MLISDGDYCGGMGGTLAILPQAAILPAVTQQWGSTGPSVSGFADRAYGPTGGVHGQMPRTWPCLFNFTYTFSRPKRVNTTS